ncbi:MAG TPA: arginine--tRNA ligase [Candidatus Saccharimonadales bacterium]|nr:arginine--tRNA ligase [Candidatus Saccharimonadales bacterium]
MIKEKIIVHLQEVLTSMSVPIQNLSLLHLEIPTDLLHGDYTTNIAFQLSKTLKKSPIQIAQEISSKLNEKTIEGLKKIEAVNPGFINFTVSQEEVIRDMNRVIESEKKVVLSAYLKNRKILVEYAHPNTHKEMHIGHMRTLITGESIARLLESQGVTVFRANYQGDIGLHVAKAMVGIQELMHKEAKEKGVTFEQLWKEKRNINSTDKAHFLGLGYIEGSNFYQNEQGKRDIDLMNLFLYQKLEGVESTSSYSLQEQEAIWSLYQETRQWSLDYYNDFYKRFYTKFDQLFFESEMVKESLEIVREAVGKVFTESDGAVIFSGEQYGLHTRVFITKAGHPTYEAKDIANAFHQYEKFPFDKRIHIVGNEQSGYFQVIFKALELLDAEKFKDKQYHLPMGMVQFADRKMSSRTGDILRVDWLIDQVKEAVDGLFKEGSVIGEDKRALLEEIAIGAIKYSVLKVNCVQNAAFDIKTSVSLQGNSGPYIQYTYARTQSILRKAQGKIDLTSNDSSYTKDHYEIEEDILMHRIYQFSDVVEKATRSYSPNVICEYLFTLAQEFNAFYQKYRIIDASLKVDQICRLRLTQSVGEVLQEGLRLLGIVAPKEM